MAMSNQYFIGVEDLAGNALIQLIEKQGSSKVSFKQIKSYGMEIEKTLKEKKIEVIISLFNRSDGGSIHDSTEYFEIIDEEYESYVSLRRDKSVDDLRKHFRASLPLNILLVFVAKESLECLS